MRFRPTSPSPPNADDLGDRILLNTGNGPDGKAAFVTLPATTLPPATQRASRKATVADLNADGRLDVVVMVQDLGPDSRPVILRNVSVAGEVAFVDWTPGNAFPSGDLHKGWHAEVFDTGGDGDLDILLGGWTDDHLFENVPPLELEESELKSQILPPLFDRDAAALVGTAAAGEVDTYLTSDGAVGFIAVVLNGPGDYRLELRDENDTVLGESDCGGAGIEEAAQVDISGQTTIVVDVLDCGPATGDLNGDCTFDVTDFLGLLNAWGPNPGHPADDDGNGVVDVLDFLALLNAWGPVTQEYLLEILTRG